MTTLSHNEPLVRKMLKSYWANYRIKPDAAEIEASVSWGMSFEDSYGKLDKDPLEYALDVDNHGDLAQNRNPRLFDLKRLANNYRESRGDFFRPALPDTSLSKEPECLYCAGGLVYDVVFEGDKWSVKKIGTCAVCSGGTARTNAVFIEKAELYNINVGDVMHHFFLGLLYYKFKNGLMKIPKAAVEDALEIFGQKEIGEAGMQAHRLRAGLQEWGIEPPEQPATPAKEETGTKVPDYDFGDGFVRENPLIPF